MYFSSSLYSLAYICPFVWSKILSESWVFYWIALKQYTHYLDIFHFWIFTNFTLKSNVSLIQKLRREKNKLEDKWFWDPRLLRRLKNWFFGRLVNVSYALPDLLKFHDLYTICHNSHFRVKQMGYSGNKITRNVLEFWPAI
jgi:hypothetical protein